MSEQTYKEWAWREAAQAAQLGAIKSARIIYYGSSVRRSGWWIMFEVPTLGKTAWITLRDTREERTRIFATVDAATKAAEKLGLGEITVDFGELRRWRLAEEKWEKERLEKIAERDRAETLASLEIKP